MGLGYKIPFFVLAIAVVSGLTGYFILRDGELPTIPGDQYWGSASSRSVKEDKSIRPFQINISEKVLTDLKTRLSLEVATLDDRVADPIEGIGFEYGFNKNFLRKVITHWLNKYLNENEWRQREKMMNKYPSFKTRIAGIDIHFQHVKPTKKNKNGSRPLLLLHGWPGSFNEYQKMIPILVDPKDSDINFELVIASLPGFGFSEAPKKTGLGAAEMSPIFLELMKRLGHEKFYVGGSDWGSLISSNMATLYKDNILGAHMTMCNSFHPRSMLKFGLAIALPQFFMEPQEVGQYIPIFGYLEKLIKETGYFHLQATKPDTIGISLSYSPSGLAAYILEKFSFWTNPKWLSKPDGGISSFNLDELLDNIMIYWVGNPTTSMRIYREAFNLYTTHQFALERVPVQVPVSCFNLPYELLTQPKFALLEKFPNLRYVNAKTGGHLSGFEIPAVVAEDIVEAFNFMEKEASKPKEEKLK